MNYRSVAELFDEVNQLRGAVAEDSAARIAGWTAAIERQEFVPSAENLAHYLALRRRDVRPLQLELMVRGLSSLGRAESRVMPALDAVAGALGVLAGRTASAAEPEATFFAGEERLAARTTELLGVAAAHRPVRILVTVPSEASTNAGFMVRLAELGVEAVELHTGSYANATSAAEQGLRLTDLARGGELVRQAGLALAAGHGLTYRNVVPVARLEGMGELNIGHSIVARAVLVGFTQAVKEMKALLGPA